MLDPQRAAWNEAALALARLEQIERGSAHWAGVCALRDVLGELRAEACPRARPVQYPQPTMKGDDR